MNDFYKLVVKNKQTSPSALVLLLILILAQIPSAIP